MQRLVDGYATIISSSAQPSEKFWGLNRRIKKDRRAGGVEAGMRRPKMHQNIASLLNESAITMDDLADFSDDAKDYVVKIRGL